MLCLGVKQVAKQGSAKVIVNFIIIFSKLWVKCIRSFLPIYKDLWDPQPTESKIYESSLQPKKRHVKPTSE